MDLNNLHVELFKMLVLIDDICQKENISYYISSGTLIGAVREHDFIPWDDDADIEMSRDDYVRFREVAKNYFPNNIRLIEPGDFAPYFFDMIPHIINMDVPLRKETDWDRAYKNYENRASVDIFIYDSTSNSKTKQKVQNLRAKVLYGLLMSKRYSIDWSLHNSFFERLEIKVLILFGKLFSLNKLISLYEKNLTAYIQENSDYYIHESIITALLIYKKKYHDKLIYMDFHGRKFPVPEMYDPMLRQYYGDYMTPVKDGYIVHTERDDT